MKGVQCDNCRKFSKEEAGWLIVNQYSNSSGFSMTQTWDTCGTFCSLKCLAECTWAHLVLDEARR